MCVCVCITSSSLMGNSGGLTWVRHSRRSSRKSSATHYYQCVQYLGVSKQWYGCQCLWVLMCTQLLMQAIAHGGCANTVRESALKADWEKNPVHHRGLEPESVLLQPFQSDAVPTELLATCSRDRQKALLRHSAFWHLVFRISLPLKNGITPCIVHALWNEIN